MPKKSREQTLNTIDTIMSAVVDQLIVLGYDRMSYTTLSEQTGISRTGISHHFPKKTDFTLRLNGQIFDRLQSHLIINHDLLAFKESWIQSLANQEFCALLRLIYHHAVASEQCVYFAKETLDKLYQNVEARFGRQAIVELDALIGHSLLKLCQ